jgi:hypothetical protein
MTTLRSTQAVITTAPTARAALPAVSTSLAAPEILDRLETASRRGRLPGFERRNGSFAVAAHGHPFDGELDADIQRDGAGSRIEFDLRLQSRLPIIFAFVLAFTVWPGVYFMDELVEQFMPGLWRPWITYYWYLPLTLLPIPWMWRSLMRRSRDSTRESAAEAIEKIAGEVDGTVSEP